MIKVHAQWDSMMMNAAEAFPNKNCSVAIVVVKSHLVLVMCDITLYWHLWLTLWQTSLHFFHFVAESGWIIDKITSFLHTRITWIHEVCAKRAIHYANFRGLADLEHFAMVWIRVFSRQKSISPFWACVYRLPFWKMKNRIIKNS